MDEFVLSYIQVLKTKAASNTVEAYLRDLTRFVDFLSEKNENILTIEPITILEYVHFLKEEKKAVSSITRNIVVLRNFYKYLYNKEIIKKNPVSQYEAPKIKRFLPEILTVEEVDILLEAPDIGGNKGIRDKAMLELMYAAGIKVSELLNLKVDDINLKLNYIKCLDAKASERIIPIGSISVKCLEKYIKIRNEYNVQGLDYLFFNLQGYKMTRQGFWKIVKHYAKEANIKKKINCYTLRHSFAVHLLQNGADIKTIQELLGHGALATTQIYASISKKSKIAEIYRSTHPRA